MKKMAPKIILEGTRLTFKTEIAFALNEHPRLVGPRRYRYHSPLVSAEWCGFTNFPWGRGLINFAPACTGCFYPCLLIGRDLEIGGRSEFAVTTPLSAASRICSPFRGSILLSAQTIQRSDR
jgi:hypothetical protein